MTTIARTPDHLERRRFDFVLGGELKILVVDDDPIQLEFSAVYLGAPGVEIVTADCAEAGLAELDRTAFDAALIDVDMPGMSGIEMLRVLRADARFDRLPVMIVTGREDMGSIDDAYAAGATSFQCKPVNWRLIAHHVRYMIRAHAALATPGGPDAPR